MSQGQVVTPVLRSQWGAGVRRRTFPVAALVLVVLVASSGLVSGEPTPAGSRAAMGGPGLGRWAAVAESDPSPAEPVADAPATFAANTGQLPSSIRFYAAGPSHSVSFTTDWRS